ncbi:MAG: hypothetical protein KAI61_05875 [Alphaproteobacteria bacterium]|nr:hypothetical protein [Alphaproteobacteria bacterium]MCK5659079.1 hypothetical protein [Alphaproteobacteria bacterium]
MTNGWDLWRYGQKGSAAIVWEELIKSSTNDLEKASAHAGLGIYYAEKKEKDKSLYHANLALELTPSNATISYAMNMNALGITLAKNKDYAHAESILKKVAGINELNEKSSAQKSTHERAKNGYNLASQVYMPQAQAELDKNIKKKKFDEAIKELKEEVIPRYEAIRAYPASASRIESDLAAAHHRVAESYIGISDTTDNLAARPQILAMAKKYEDQSLALWIGTASFPKRVKTAEDNIKNLEEKITTATKAADRMNKGSSPKNSPLL